MIEVENTQKAVKVQREFSGMEAHEDGKRLTVFYKEETLVDGEVIKSGNKQYSRDFDFWKASELGQAIIGMINLDLTQVDPSAPRTEPVQ